MEREEIRFVQARYGQLNLNAQQAEVALQYEEMRDSRSDTHFFSAWEEWDFEYSVFREILSEEQMIEYQKRVAEQKEWHIENIINQDQANSISLDHIRETVDYLKTTLIPSILFDRSQMVLSLVSDRSKVDYLKVNYRTFLHDRRKQILVDHFRYNSFYAPIQLKSTLLGHYASCLLPNYVAFEAWMDEPTRAVAEFLKTKLSRKHSEIREFHLGKLAESKAFSQQIKEKYSRHFEGWHVWEVDPLPEEQEKQNWLMSMLLLDGNAYGFEAVH
ncbi:hypothetical protein SAMN05216327_11336 [Dyadobacter sp. SG02]|uniref:hypothetical protein n=1 Tax=Dyadobacter sp. SG02 TaxID=1855291 RepID=UPI0008CE4005|nr:hypothetical protein [Dyadobacter sp. SG02]SEJ57897.1 hypothetical protein SAMN05216327_11336 [Dyadobacter sp. SG02]